jgi:hypothetical protein
VVDDSNENIEILPYLGNNSLILKSTNDTRFNGNIAGQSSLIGHGSGMLQNYVVFYYKPFTISQKYIEEKTTSSAKESNSIDGFNPVLLISLGIAFMLTQLRKKK